MTATLPSRTFVYEAVDRRGKRSKGTLDGANEAAVAATLRAQGATPISIAEAGTGLSKEITIPGLGDRVGLKDLAIFTRQFATMTGAGLSLLRSLAVLEQQAAKPRLARAIRQVRRDVESGSSLSAALGQHDKIFPRLMVAMVAAGETGGFLDGALDRVAANLEKDANLRAKIKSALTYPVIVLCFSVVMIAGVLVFIVPIFSKMFASLNAQLPLPTRLMVALSHQMAWAVPLLILLAVTGTAGLKHQLRTAPAWRLAADRLKLRLIVFGPLFTKIAVSRFARNLGTLLSVGVPIMQALDIVGATTGNAVIGEAMADVRKSVREGRPMSAPLARHSVFPLMVTQMLQVGEETGQISTMLDKVADFYDQEVETAAEQLTAAIEPVMVVLMGAIVGVMIICLYLPMFTVYQHIQGAS